MTQKIGFVFAACAAFFFLITGNFAAAMCLGLSAVFHAEGIAAMRDVRLSAKERTADVADLWRRDQ